MFLGLASGNNTYSGRVEVFYNDQWGTVCDDFWMINDASVACRQLGFPYGASEAISQYGGGTGPIWLDDLDCWATGDDLFNCVRRGNIDIGTNNCVHSEDAGAVCIPVRKFHRFQCSYTVTSCLFCVHVLYRTC